MDIRIRDTVLSKAPTLFVMTRVVRDVHVTPATPEQEKRKEAILARWAGTTEEQLDATPLIIAYRELQKQLGGDPEQMLPAVEGLLRRAVLQGKFPKVHSVVDAANIVAVTRLVPIGLFDFDRIEGDIELTLAVAGDEFVPIGGKKPVKLSPGTPILKDAGGIFSAVGSRDSKRTMIGRETGNVLAFSWGIEGIDPTLVSSVLDECAGAILKS